MTQKQRQKTKETKKTQESEKELLMKQWLVIESEANYLARTDKSNLSWRELLSRPHECSN